MLIRDCCDEVAPRPDRNVLCRGRCADGDDDDDDDDDDKCSDGSNQDFLDDLNECLDSESADGDGLECYECE